MRLRLAAAVLAVLFACSLPASSAGGEDKDAVPDVLVPNVLRVDAATGAASFEDHHEALTDVEVSGVASAASGFNLVNPAGVVVFQNQSSTFAGVASFWQQALAPGVYGVFGPRPDGSGSGLVVTFQAPVGAQPALGPAVSSPCLNGVKLGNWLNSDDASVCGISPPPVTSPCDHSDTCNAQVCDGGGVGCIADRLPCGGAGEPPCNATGLCQLLPSQCSVPTLGSCPDGKTGSTINGATTACVAVPKVGSCPSGKVGATVNDNPAACIGANPPCGTAASCEDYACSLVPCGGPSGPCLGSPSLADCLVDTGCDPAIDLCNTALGCATYPDACTPSVSAPDADPNDPNPPNPDCSGDTTAVETVTKLSETTVWTPQLIIHSPYGGSADGTGTWATSSGVFVAGHGHTSTLNGGVKTGTLDGKTKGVFQVAKWGYYEYNMNYRCGSYGTHYYYAKIIDDQPNGFREWKSFELWGNNQKTDRDDWETISGCGSSGKCYNSVRFDNEYVHREAAWDTTGGGFHVLVGSRTYQAGGVTITFSLRTGPVSFGMAGSYVADQTSDAYFDYNLPAGGQWSGDHLGTSSSSAYAFCDDLRNGNC
jgi:hypothetical protein